MPAKIKVRGEPITNHAAHNLIFIEAHFNLNLLNSMMRTGVTIATISACMSKFISSSYSKN